MSRDGPKWEFTKWELCHGRKSVKVATLCLFPCSVYAFFLDRVSICHLQWERRTQPATILIPVWASTQVIACVEKASFASRGGEESSSSCRLLAPFKHPRDRRGWGERERNLECATTMHQMWWLQGRQTSIKLSKVVPEI